MMKNKINTGLSLLLIIFLSSCSIGKNEVWWISGFTTNKVVDEVETERFYAYKGNDLEGSNWNSVQMDIKDFEYEEGYLKKVKLKKQKDGQTNQNNSYIMKKELEKKSDKRLQLDGNWTLVSLNKKQLDKKIVSPTLKIDLKKMELSGNGGCNQYFAQITNLSPSEITLNDVARTLRGCLSDDLIEDEYMKYLSTVKEYLSSETELTLIDAEGKEVLKFQKIKEVVQVSLQKWVNVRIYGERIKTDTPPTFEFDEKSMKFSGQDGCNRFFGSVKFHPGNKLTVSDFGTTKMMCADMIIPDAFQEAIHLVDSFDFVKGELIYKDKDGKEMLAFKLLEE